jgi:uncharacterized membrane protein
MEASQVFLVVVTVLCFFCTGASWMLQFVAYPTYALVGKAEFVPYHVDFGKRMLPVTVVPMVLTCIGLIALVFLRPSSVPLWIALVSAACGVLILVTTIFLEVPKHLALDKDGKSDTLIRGLVRDNIPRTLAWTTASLVLAAAVVLSTLPPAV